MQVREASWRKDVAPTEAGGRRQSSACAQVNREGEGPLHRDGQTHTENLSEGPGYVEAGLLALLALQRGEGSLPLASSGPLLPLSSMGEPFLDYPQCDQLLPAAIDMAVWVLVSTLLQNIANLGYTRRADVFPAEMGLPAAYLSLLDDKFRPRAQASALHQKAGRALRFPWPPSWPSRCSGPSPSRFTCAQAELWRRPPASVRATSFHLATRICSLRPCPFFWAGLSQPPVNLAALSFDLHLLSRASRRKDVALTEPGGRRQSSACVASEPRRQGTARDGQTHSEDLSEGPGDVEAGLLALLPKAAGRCTPRKEVEQVKPFRAKGSVHVDCQRNKLEKTENSSPTGWSEYFRRKVQEGGPGEALRKTSTQRKKAATNHSVTSAKQPQVGYARLVEVGPLARARGSSEGSAGLKLALKLPQTLSILLGWPFPATSQSGRAFFCRHEEEERARPLRIGAGKASPKMNEQSTRRGPGKALRKTSTQRNKAATNHSETSGKQPQCKPLSALLSLLPHTLSIPWPFPVLWLLLPGLGKVPLLLLRVTLICCCSHVDTEQPSASPSAPSCTL
eukprot:SM000169S02736  [mRNA]  locus=s169:204518:211691:- [translate_table: standard]